MYFTNQFPFHDLPSLQCIPSDHSTPIPSVQFEIGVRPVYFFIAALTHIFFFCKLKTQSLIGFLYHYDISNYLWLLSGPSYISSFQNTTNT